MPLDAIGCMTRLVRPALLARAARAGAAAYRRERDLAGLLPEGGRRDLLAALFTAEEDADEARREARPDYSPARHVRLLSALLAEARAAA